MPYVEKRKQQRFPLVVPATLTVSDAKKSEVFQLRTCNLSSAGAFLESGDSVREGTRVEIELFLTVKSLLEVISADTGARVRVRGHVIRIAREGFAVEFSKGFRIRPMGRQVKEWPLK